MVTTKKPKVLKEQNTNTCLLQVEESNNSGTNNIKFTEEDHIDMTNILDQIVESGAPFKKVLQDFDHDLLVPEFSRCKKETSLTSSALDSSAILSIPLQNLIIVTR
jgi:hypothetical protein